MLLQLHELLTPDEVTNLRAHLGEDAAWLGGATTAGGQASQAKHNQQLSQQSPGLAPLQAVVRQALERHPVFLSAALPRHVFPPLFNRYRAHGEHYGPHVDGALLRSGGERQWVRSDLSCTVFLSDPDSYSGGALRFRQGSAWQNIKLAAGDAILYPSTQVHEVTPVTQGVRLASFFWVESMVRSQEQRQVLFDLDLNLVRLRERHGDSAETVALGGVYHNLLRLWAQT